MGDKAVSFKKSDTEDLKDKLNQLCTDTEDVNKYKREASEYVCSRYSWEDVTDRTLELYEK